MLWVFIGLLGGFAFVFLTRLYWADAANRPDGQPPARKPLVNLALITLATALVVMIATGKLNWISAALTGAIPFLRRGVSLLRYAPLFAGLASQVKRKAHGQTKDGADRHSPSSSNVSARLNLDQARAMLEVPKRASKDEIVAAHRKLMARNHPDRGGSNYIAAQLNEAKELLLKDSGSSNL